MNWEQYTGTEVTYIKLVYLIFELQKFNKQIGVMPLDPKAPPHPNDATYEFPGRITVDTDWTESLRSRYIN